MGKVQAANAFMAGPKTAQPGRSAPAVPSAPAGTASSDGGVAVYTPRPLEVDVLKHKSLTAKDIDGLAQAFSLMLAPGEQVRVGVWVCRRARAYRGGWVVFGAPATSLRREDRLAVGVGRVPGW